MGELVSVHNQKSLCEHVHMRAEQIHLIYFESYGEIRLMTNLVPKQIKFVNRGITVLAYFLIYYHILKYCDKNDNCDHLLSVIVKILFLYHDISKCDRHPSCARHIVHLPCCYSTQCNHTITPKKPRITFLPCLSSAVQGL